MRQSIASAELSQPARSGDHGVAAVATSAPTHPTLTLRQLHVRSVRVPLKRPLITSSGSILDAPLALIDLQTEEGVTGRAYIFSYTPAALGPLCTLLANVGTALKGRPVAPVALEAELQARFRLLGPQGLTGMAMSGIDMAAWDALARAANLPLYRLLGGAARPLPAYNSLGLDGTAAAAAQAAETAAEGFTALKIKVGYPDFKDDLAAIRAVRREVGDALALMVDYNQSLSVPEAIRRIRMLDDEGLTWIEEPTRADDYAGHATIAKAVRTPLQIGENWWGVNDMAKSIAAGASSFAMPDVMKIGGVTGWLRASALAHVSGLPVSSHIFVEISAHLLTVTPTCHYLEWLDKARPVMATPAMLVDGKVVLGDAPGSGVTFDDDAVARYAAG
jgi:mandelate racemase